MKIGIDGRASKWYRGTGIGTYTYQLINYLTLSDDTNKYYIHTPKDSPFEDNKNSTTFIPTKDTGAKNFWDDILIPNNINNLDLDLYHIPQNGIGMPGNSNCPYIITLHDIIPYKLPHTVSDKFLSIFNKYMPTIVKNSKAIITVSNFSKNDIAEAFNYNKNNIYVTHLASENIYRPLDKTLSKNILNEQYSICYDYILYVGGFSPRKNILNIINAFSLLKAHTKTKVKLVIAGNKGLSFEMYWNRVAHLGLQEEVIFPGFISMENMPYLYNAAEFLVYPSLYEGFGLPPLEAMACGIPVIASNTTSIPEVLGSCAKLINPNDTDLLYKSMANMLLDYNLRQHYIEAGAKRVELFSWEKTTKETQKIYENVIK